MCIYADSISEFLLIITFGDDDISFYLLLNSFVGGEDEICEGKEDVDKDK